MFRALFDAKVNIELITTTEIRITCLNEGAQVPKAVRALHAAFERKDRGRGWKLALTCSPRYIDGPKGGRMI